VKRRGFTLVETAVTSGILLLMVGLASLAITSYVRSYRHYSQQGMRLRLAAKALETVGYRLRSAKILLAPIPASLAQNPLQFQTADGALSDLLVQKGKLVCRRRDEQGKVVQTQVLGEIQDLRLRLQDSFLILQAEIPDAQPLETQLSLRGVVLP